MFKYNFFILIITAVLFYSCNKTKNDLHVASEGVTDLRNYDFSTYGTVELSGEWEFYWNQFLTPEDFKKSVITCDYIFAPSGWTTGKYGSKKYPKFGFATYRLKVLLPENEKDLKIILPQETYSALKIWINDSLYHKTGKVGKDKNSEIGEYNCFEKYFTKKTDIENKDTLSITVQMSNHAVGSYYPGMMQGIQIGLADEILQKYNWKTVINSVLVAMLLLMGVYHLIFFAYKRNEIAILIFSIIAISLFVRGLATSGLLMRFFTEDLQLAFKLHYLPVPIYMGLIALFVNKLIEGSVNKIILKILLGLSAIFLVIIIFSPPLILSNLDTILVIILIPEMFYLTIITAINIFKRHKGAIWAFAGFLILLFSNIIDTLRALDIIHTQYITNIGFSIFVFFQSINLAKRFSIMFKQNTELNQILEFQNSNLEDIVKSRTAEIVQQKEEILTQKEEMASQTEELLAQKEEFITIYEKLSDLNSELEKLSAVVRETDNAVLILDEHANIEWANEGFTKMFGYTFEEFLEEKGRNFYEITNSEEGKHALNRCISDKITTSYTSVFETQNKEEVWTQTTLTPIISDGAISKIIAIDSNITKLKKAESEIKFKNEQINSSIKYAGTIQNAILPEAVVLNQYFDNFVIFRPKDIVSGDFYWFSDTSEKYNFFAVVDCTGHGVPGAFMSMIGNRLLNELVNEREIVELNEILTQMNLNIIKSLKQNKNINNDGMDICLCRFNKNDNTVIEFSGAKRNLLVYRTNQKMLSVIKGDRISVGGVSNTHSEFTVQKLKLEKNDVVYLTTDGYADQNNYERKKIGTSLIFKNIENIASLPMVEQKVILEKFLDNWMEKTVQRDDITIVGLKI